MLKRFHVLTACVFVMAAMSPGMSMAAESRHAWKAQLREAKLVHERDTASGVGPVPAHFGSLSPEARLAYLLARRGVDPVRFDHFHPKLGPFLATDERLRAAGSQLSAGMGGLFPDNALTRYLHYRRNLNPKRFDHYHASLGALLAEDDRLRRIVAGQVAGELIPPMPTIPAPTGSPSPDSSNGGASGGISSAGGGGGGGISPSSVPEPGSLTLLAVGAVAAGVCRLRKRPRDRG